MSRTIVIEHEGRTLYGSVATIKSTHLGPEDHGIFTAYLHLEGDGWGVGVGGYALGDGYALDHIHSLMSTVGVRKWEDLSGKQVIALRDRPDAWGGISIGIAHISDEKRVLVLKDHAQAWRDEREKASA